MKKTGLLTLLSTAVVVAAIANGPYLFATQQSTDYNPQAVLQADTTGIAPGIAPGDTTGTAPGDTPADSLAAIVTESSVELTFTNDGNHPWTVEDGYIMSASMEKYTASTMSFSFQTDETVELSFIGININGDNHRSEIYVDGAFYKSITSGSENNVRMFLKPGSHIVMFRDSISGWFYDNQQTTLRNLRIRDIVPLETLPLMEGSLPLTFTNDVSGYPWTVEDGYLQNGNHTFANSVSRFSTTFTIDTVSWFRFERQVTPYNTYWGNNTNLSYQYLYTRINGELAMTDWDNSGFDMFETVLEPGTYTVEWTDTIANTTSPYYARIRNIGVLNGWESVELASAGTLGVEVLYKFDVLDDVRMLRVKGTLNSTDWTTIKNMKNIVALDLEEAKFDAVPNGAFDGLGRLQYLTLPEGMKSIGEYAFRGTNLIKLNIPATVISIGQYAFASTPIKNVTFTEGSQLKNIDNHAFYRCTSLEEFIMPNTVTELGTEQNNPNYDSNIFRECTSLKKLHFSDALSVIPRAICYECTSLQDLHLPEGLTTIKQYGFYRTSGLRKVDFPEGLRTIEEYAFQYCALDSAKLPIGLTSLGENAFEECKNLKYIELPSYIGNYNRNFRGCTAVDKVVCRSATPPGITQDPFYQGAAKSDITLVVPSFAVVNYKLDSYWYQFGSIIEGDDIGYWKITSALALTNNRRMDGKPDIDLYFGGQFTVGGNAPMETGQLNFYLNESNPGRLLNDCPDFTADSINTYFSVDANRWYFLTPLHDVDLTKVTHSAGASFVFRYYDAASRAANGTGNSWKNVDTGRLLAGQGYIFQCNAAGTLTLPASAEAHAQVLGIDDVTTQLQAHEAAASANKGWNYVGNPYPAYYDIYYMDFTAPVTVWDGSTYRAYSIVDDNLVLRPMQSFFVQKPDAVDNIIFHKEGRQLGSAVERPSYAKRYAPASGSRSLFDVSISGDAGTDRTRVVVNADASAGYELQCDAAKFMSMDGGVPQVFTRDAKGNAYAINERPLADGIVTLGYSAAKPGFYTFSAVRADGEALLLFDGKENKTVDLLTQDYTFHSEATDGADTGRFSLKLVLGDQTPTGVDAADGAAGVAVAGGDGCIRVSAPAGSSVSVYSLDGRCVYEGRCAAVQAVIPVAPGAYAVAVDGRSFKATVR